MRKDFVNGIKDPRKDDCLGCSSRQMNLQGIAKEEGRTEPKRGEGRKQKVGRKKDAVLQTLILTEGPQSQRQQAASGSWKIHRN